MPNFSTTQHSGLDGREIPILYRPVGTATWLLCTTDGVKVYSIEGKAIVTAGKGVLHLTGRLGDIIKQSARVALSWVNVNAAGLKLSADYGKVLSLDERDIHIHIPPSAEPKDGPSAGVTLATSLVSMSSGRRVRADTAMIGEMTLGGSLLSVEGITNKILGARDHGIKRVILPTKNYFDLWGQEGIDVLNDMEIIPAETMEEVLEDVLEGVLPWEAALVIAERS